jgi:hypothetical protein
VYKRQIYGSAVSVLECLLSLVAGVTIH